MRRIFKENRLLAALLVLVMLLCSFPMVYAEDAAAEIAVAEQEYTPETEPETVTAEAEPAAESEPAEVPAEEPETETAPAEDPEEAPAEECEPEEIPEEAPVQEPEATETAEEEPAVEADPAEIPEEIPEETETETEAETEPKAEVEPEAEAEAAVEEESEEDADEEAAEEALYEFDDDEVGSVSEELLEIFNNPDTYERIEFTGSVEIELKNSEICYDRDVTLVARVSGADMDYRLVWEANDGSGWFPVASGHEYTFLLTPDIVSREYRVVLFRVC